MKKKILSMALAAVMLTPTISALAEENAFVVLQNDSAVKSDAVLVEILSPAAGSSVHAGYNMTALVDAEAEGGIGKVEFYSGSELVGTDNKAPYEMVIPVADKDVVLTARAYTADEAYYNEASATVKIKNEYVEYLNATFEESTTTNLNLHNGPTIVDGSTVPDGDEERSGKVLSVNVGTKTQFPRYLNSTGTPLSGKVTLEFDFLLDGELSANTNLMYFQTSGPEFHQVVELVKNSSGLAELVFRYTKNDNSQHERYNVGVLEANSWHNIRMDINIDNLTFDAYVDGVQKFSGLRLPLSTGATNDIEERKAMWSKVTAIQMKASKAIQFYIDNWKIHTTVEETNPYYLNATFEESTTTNLNLHNGPTIVDGSTVPDGDEERSGKVLSVNVGTKTQFPRYLNSTGTPLSGKVTLEFDFLLDGALSANTNLMYFQTSDPEFHQVVEFVKNGSGLAELIFRYTKNDNSQHERYNVGVLEANSWHNIRMDINIANLTFDAYVDGVQKFSGLRLPLSTGATNDIEERKAMWSKVTAIQMKASKAIQFYIDNWKIYKLPGEKALGTVFESADGVLSIDKTAVPYMTKQIAVTYDEAMDASSFTGITLTEGSSDIDFEGSYNEAAKQYVITFDEPLAQKEEYVLSMPETILTAAGNPAEAYTVNFTTTYEDIEVNSTTWYGADDAALDKTATGGTLKAVVNAENHTDSAKVLTAILAVYDSDNSLVGCAVTANDEIAANIPEDITVTLTDDAPADLTGYTARVYIWDSISGMIPLVNSISLQ